MAVTADCWVTPVHSSPLQHQIRIAQHSVPPVPPVPPLWWNSGNCYIMSHWEREGCSKPSQCWVARLRAGKAVASSLAAGAFYSHAGLPCCSAGCSSAKISTLKRRYGEPELGQGHRRLRSSQLGTFFSESPAASLFTSMQSHNHRVRPPRQYC